jgi:hypothetical protein
LSAHCLMAFRWRVDSLRDYAKHQGKKVASFGGDLAANGRVV